MIRIGGLISGGGRTLLNLLDTIERGELDAEVATVIASRGDIAGVARLRERGLDVHIIDRTAYPEADARDDAITQCLTEAGTELVALCGYLRFFRVDPAWAGGRALNIHPALLPKHGGPGMYGDRVHAAVLAAGDRESGCTVHIVDDEYDHGPVVVQRRCPVLPGDDVDTLAARVFAEECHAYPEAIRIIAGRSRALEAEGQ